MGTSWKVALGLVGAAAVSLAVAGWAQPQAMGGAAKGNPLAKLGDTTLMTLELRVEQEARLDKQRMQTSKTASMAITSMARRFQLVLGNAPPDVKKGRQTGLTAKLTMQLVGPNRWQFEGEVEFSYLTAGLIGESNALREFTITTALSPGEQVQVASWVSGCEAVEPAGEGKEKKMELEDAGRMFLSLRPAKSTPTEKEGG